MGLESIYDLDTGSSISEEATLEAQQGILEDMRELSVSSDASAAQNYFGNGYSGTATMSALNAGGSLKGHAYLTGQSMHASQLATLSGSQATAGMTLTNQGASASLQGIVTDGSLHSILSSCTGSANVAGQFSAIGDSVQVAGSAMQGEDWGRLTSTASALDWTAAEFNGWMFASASSEDHATHITQDGGLSGGLYRAFGQAVSSSEDSELRKSRRAYDGTFGTTVDIRTDDLGRTINGLSDYWFVKTGESIQSVLNQADDGDEVELDSGMFTENIAIDKFLNIYGQGISTTAINAADEGKPTISVANGGSGTLSISDLTASGAKGTGSSGILISGTGSIGNIELTDIGSCGNYFGVDVEANGAGNRIFNMKFDGLEISNSMNNGLQIQTASGGTIEDLNLDGATILDSAGDGIHLIAYGTMGDLNLNGATISGSSVNGFDVMNYGTIGDINLDRATISGSRVNGFDVMNYGTIGDINLDRATISGSGGNGVDIYTTIIGKAGDLRLDGATISGSRNNGVGITTHGTIGDINFGGATISASGTQGINVLTVGTMGDLSLDGATISGAGWDGVSVTTSAPGAMGILRLDGATISGSGNDGVAVTTYGTMGLITMDSGTIARSGDYGMSLRKTGAIGTATISNANIYSNSKGGIYCSGVAVDATNNWWGSASGPYQAILNPSGSGNALSSGVTFVPWRYAPITA